MINWILQNIAPLGALGAAIAFAWSVVQFILVRRKDQQLQDFNAYHKLIKELTQPDSESGLTWLDRQVAVVFELRNFPRYYPVTERILDQWRLRISADNLAFLLAEIDLTLQHLRSKA